MKFSFLVGMICNAGKSSIAYSNKINSRILGVNFKQANVFLNKFEMAQLEDV